MPVVSIVRGRKWRELENKCDPSLVMENLPPPWTVHEAAECLKMRYADDADVVDAANKFLHISLVSGGIRGKIRPNISPHKFMKMYSYGVYLIDALQSILIDNEDLQAAEASLSKLLQDVEHPQTEDMEQPSLERSNLDSFADNSVQDKQTNMPDLVVNDTIKTIVNPEENNKQDDLKTSPRKKQSKSPASTPGKYYLRSKTKKTKDVTEDNSESVNHILSKSLFLTNLELKNKEPINSGNYVEKTPNKSSITGLVTTEDVQEEFRSPGIQRVNQKVNTINSKIVTDKITNKELKCEVTEPKIIRNFSKCLEFEERLKKKKPVFLSDANICSDSDKDLLLNTQKSVEFYDDGDVEDYGTDYIDFNEDGTFWHELSNIPPVYNSPRISKAGDTSNSENSPRVPKTLDTINFKESHRFLGTVINTHSKNSPPFLKTADTTSSLNEIVSFKPLMHNLLEEPIKKAFLSIHDFCIKSGERIESQELIADLNEIKTRAEKEISCLDGLLSKLKIITSNKDRQFEGMLTEDADIKMYRIFIENCLEQGEILKEALTLVLEACTSS